MPSPVTGQTCIALSELRRLKMLLSRVLCFTSVIALVICSYQMAVLPDTGNVAAICFLDTSRIESPL